MRKKKVALFLVIGVISIPIYINFSNNIFNSLSFLGETEQWNTCEDAVVKTVRGSSMEPLLHEGNDVAVYLHYYECNDISRGDVVLIEYQVKRNVPLIKRILAIPGDEIEVQKNENQDGIDEVWNILVNGEVIKNSEGTTYSFTDEKIAHIRNDVLGYNGVIPEKYYLVLGDNPNGTLDSTVTGLFSEEMVIGKADVIVH